MSAVLPEGRLGALLRRDRRGQGLRVEPPRPPGNRCEVDGVLDAVVLERNQELLRDAVQQVATEDEVVVAELEQRATIEAIGRRRQAEQKPGFKVREHLLVRRGSRVVELVDDDVVEVIRRER